MSSVKALNFCIKLYTNINIPILKETFVSIVRTERRIHNSDQSHQIVESGMIIHSGFVNLKENWKHFKFWNPAPHPQCLIFLAFVMVACCRTHCSHFHTSRSWVHLSVWLHFSLPLIYIIQCCLYN